MLFPNRCWRQKISRKVWKVWELLRLDRDKIISSSILLSCMWISSREASIYYWANRCLVVKSETLKSATQYEWCSDLCFLISLLLWKLLLHTLQTRNLSQRLRISSISAKNPLIITNPDFVILRSIFGDAIIIRLLDQLEEYRKKAKKWPLRESIALVDLAFVLMPLFVPLVLLYSELLDDYQSHDYALNGLRTIQIPHCMQIVSFFWNAWTAIVLLFLTIILYRKKMYSLSNFVMQCEAYLLLSAQIPLAQLIVVLNSSDVFR